MSENKQLDVLALQRRISGGDQAAFKALYSHYSRPLFQFAIAIIHTRELAEEIVADVFIQVWNKRERVGEIENLNWYLFVATRNIAISYYRKNNRRKTFDFDEVSMGHYQVVSTPEDIMIGQEFLNLVNKAINELPPKCRLIFKLVKEDNLKYREVAELLDITPKTVENQVGMALKKMHAAIRRPLPQPRRSIQPK